MQNKELASLMALLANEFDNDKPISKIKIELWNQELVKKYGIFAIKQAVKNIIHDRSKYNKGFPTISEMECIINKSDIDIEDVALHQWIAVKEALISIGTYKPVKFDDALIHKVINSIGGWIELGQTELAQMQWKEKEFIRNYISFANMQEVDNCPAYLPGVHSNSYLNDKYGHEIKSVEIKTIHPRKILNNKNVSNKVLSLLKNKMDKDKE